jgi:hypothetical protein
MFQTGVGWKVGGSDQYLVAPNLTSRPACKTPIQCFSCERNKEHTLSTKNCHLSVLSPSEAGAGG